MSTLKILLAEIAHRKGNFLLSLIAVVVAAMLFVASPTILSGYRGQTEAELTKQQNVSRELLAEGRRETRVLLAEQQRETQTLMAQEQQQAEEELAATQLKADTHLKKMEDDTRKLMVKLGFNLRIVHRDTDMTDLYTNFVAKDMPYEYVRRLADSPLLTKVVHLVPALHGMIQWEDRRRLLSGFAPEVTQSHIGVKKPMGYIIQQGTVYLGHEAGIGHKVDETVEIMGKKFHVAKIIDERGTKDDIMIAMNLKDAQDLLKKPGVVTEILALNCKCETVDRLAEIREQLEAILPEAKVSEHRSKAIARAKQRELAKELHKTRIRDLAADLRQLQQSLEANRSKQRQSLSANRDKHEQSLVAAGEKHEKALIAGRQKSEQLLGQLWTVITPLVIAVCCAWVALLTWSNVRDRRAEIGLFRALGKGSARIAALFLGKALILGLAGGAIGSAAGFVLAQTLAIGQMGIDPELVTLPRLEFLLALLGTPLIAALASYLPTLSAISQDPAVALRDA